MSERKPNIPRVAELRYANGIVHTVAIKRCETLEEARDDLYRSLMALDDIISGIDQS